MYNGKLTVMAVHAHPDDELIGTGPLLARYAHEGVECVLVTCTRGEAGEIHDPDLKEEEARPILGEIRLRELACALAILGVQHSEQLGYRDSGMVGTAENDDPRSFHMADMEEAVGRLVAHVRHYQPEVIVTYNEFGGYGHPDHINAHRIAVAAFDAAADPTLYPQAGAPWQAKKLYYTSWNIEEWQKLTETLKERGLPSPWGDDEEPADLSEEDRQKRADETQKERERSIAEAARVTTKMDNTAYTNLVFQAARCHRSQFAQDGVFFTMPEDLQTLAFGHDWFIRARSLVAVAEKPESDLLVGLAGG